MRSIQRVERIDPRALADPPGRDDGASVGGASARSMRPGTISHGSPTWLSIYAHKNRTRSPDSFRLSATLTIRLGDNPSLQSQTFRFLIPPLTVDL